MPWRPGKEHIKMGGGGGVILALQGYILGFFPKFRQRKSGLRLGQRTRMLLSLRRPQGGACCGLSSLRLSSEFPGSWRPLSRKCRLPLRRSPSKRTASSSPRLHASPPHPPGLRIQPLVLPLQPGERPTGTKAGRPSTRRKHPS